MKTRNKAVLYAVLAAVLYGISAPGAKLLLVKIQPAMMASLLYLGAGTGMFFVRIFARKKEEAGFGKKDYPYLLGMVLLDIAAPILLMTGLASTTAGNASLLNNFEIAATALIALIVFKEAIGRRMWFAIILIFAASVVLTIDVSAVLTFSYGSLLILAAAICWGFENNFTRKLSHGDPSRIVVIKGIGSGTGAFMYAAAAGQLSFDPLYMPLALLLGFVSFGLSIFFYIRAQRHLGAARTSAFYAAAPFIGVAASYILLREESSVYFFAALVIMLAGTYLAVTEKHSHSHFHDRMVHSHSHSHDDGHHNHIHDDFNEGEHSHEHIHEADEHEHSHTPDIHHRHGHEKK